MTDMLMGTSLGYAYTFDTVISALDVTFGIIGNWLVVISLTLYAPKSSTRQARIASLPTGIVTLVIGAVNLGFSRTDIQFLFNITFKLEI